MQFTSIAKRSFPLPVGGGCSVAAALAVVAAVDVVDVVAGVDVVAAAVVDVVLVLPQCDLENDLENAGIDCPHNKAKTVNKEQSLIFMD
ncbi:hypothetical protein OKW34_004689 [Paraburkholderia youngii]|uniref:hypothetical protein n=1 Tax=Paraburkholderia youngii TaxID=2782701 RepID=UPI003D23AF35